MKTKLTLFRRGDIYYSQDAATGQQKSLRTCDADTARKLIDAINEAQRNPHINLQLARAYLTASDPAMETTAADFLVLFQDGRASLIIFKVSSPLCLEPGLAGHSDHCPENLAPISRQRPARRKPTRRA